MWGIMARAEAYQVQGQQGGVVLAAGETGTGPFRWMTVVNDAVLETFVSNLTDGATKLITITLPKGLGIGAVITTVKVTSGVVVCYTQ